MVQEAAHGDASVSYLLSQTLLAKEVEELEAQVVGREQRLMRLVEELREHPERRAELSRLEMSVIGWFTAKKEVMKRKGDKRKR